MTESRRVTRVEGTAIPVRGHNVDTDRIIPARFLKAITFEGLGEHVFEDDRRSMPDHPFDQPRYQGAAVLLVNENFGSGSSREHAPQALKRWGIGACVGESFSEIFQGNALAIGLPCATAGHDDIEAAMRTAEETGDTVFVLDVADLTLAVGERTIDVAMPPAVREALVEGHWDGTGLLLDRFDEVRAVRDRLPYVHGFE